MIGAVNDAVGSTSTKYLNNSGHHNGASFVLTNFTL